jgi:hypothetical protein
MYGESMQPVHYYNHLLLETTDEETKHCGIITDWIVECQDAILDCQSLSINAFKDHPIKYSDQVYIDIGSIIEKATPIDRNSIFKHLLVMLAQCIPEKAIESRRKLKELVANSREKNDRFMNDFIKDLGDISELQNLESNSNVDIGGILNSIISSGAMTKIFSNLHGALSSGDLDVGELIKSAQNISQLKGLGGLGTLQ